jgi:hypothetical protein
MANETSMPTHARCAWRGCDRTTPITRSLLDLELPLGWRFLIVGRDLANMGTWERDQILCPAHAEELGVVLLTVPRQFQSRPTVC